MSKSLMLVKDSLRRAWKQLPYLGRALALTWAASRGWTLVWVVLLVVQGLLPAGMVYLTRWLVDGLVQAVGAGANWSAIQPMLIWIALYVIAMLVKEGSRSLSNFIRLMQSELVKDYANALIHQKAVELDLAFFDSPGYYDQLHRARAGASAQPQALLESTGILLQNGITLAAMLIVLIQFGVWIPLALLASTLPALYVVLQHRIQLHNWTVKNTESERRVWYYDWLLTSRESAAELRLFQVGEFFRTQYQNLRRRLREERIELVKGQGKAETLASLGAMLVSGLAFYGMILRVLRSQITLGDLALFYQAFIQGQSLMRAFLENMGEIYSSSFFLEDLFDFLALQPNVQEPKNPLPVPKTLQEGIVIEAINFTYPGGFQPALRNFNLRVNAGQIAAIVGANGAGKSTLIKLLCRFYDPQAGSITLDGADLRDFSIAELRSRITVLFQEPVNYSATVRENIALGDLSLEKQPEAVVHAAHFSGAHEPISRLPQGYDTLLGKWFKGGTDLSVGEWQRIALARSFLRNASVLILDEPTSAMDPWAEADWLTRFRKMAVGRTAILITHRFTTAAYADVIHVMDGGKIVESGTHFELMASEGAYAASWKNQMQRWREGEVKE